MAFLMLVAGNATMVNMITLVSIITTEYLQTAPVFDLGLIFIFQRYFGPWVQFAP